MSNPNIVRLLREAVIESQQEQLFEKITLIDDIIRIKKMMFGMGFNEHDEFRTNEAAGKLFDELYDMNLEQLKLIYSGYEKQVNEYMSQKIKSMKQYKRHDKRRKYWFLNRVGKEILQSTTVNKVIKVETFAHAIALYISQTEKNYTYNDIK